MDLEPVAPPTEWPEVLVQEGLPDDTILIDRYDRLVCNEATAIGIEWVWMWGEAGCWADTPTGMMGAFPGKVLFETIEVEVTTIRSTEP